MGSNEGVREPVVFTINTIVTEETFGDLLELAGLSVDEQQRASLWQLTTDIIADRPLTPLSFANAFFTLFRARNGEHFRDAGITLMEKLDVGHASAAEETGREPVSFAINTPITEENFGDLLEWAGVPRIPSPPRYVRGSVGGYRHVS